MKQSTIPSQMSVFNSSDVPVDSSTYKLRHLTPQATGYQSNVADLMARLLPEIVDNSSSLLMYFKLIKTRHEYSDLTVSLLIKNTCLMYVMLTDNLDSFKVLCEEYSPADYGDLILAIKLRATAISCYLFGVMTPAMAMNSIAYAASTQSVLYVSYVIDKMKGDLDSVYNTFKDDPDTTRYIDSIISNC